MIVKTSQRDGAAWLAAHLTRADTNESVEIVGGRDIVALDVRLALRQFEAQWRLSGSRARDFLVHAAISPSQPLSREQWAEAWRIYEWQHCLHGQPYIEVEHGKPGETGRPSHRHRVYLRVRTDGRAVHLAFTHRVNEVIARLCELSFAHPLTRGAHNRAVVNYLEQNGYSEEAEQLRSLTAGRRPRAARSESEAQQESRSGCSKAAAAKIVAAAWHSADGPHARRAALAEAGFTLARGDRRDTVIAVDASGKAWALNRLLTTGERGAWTAARVRRDLEGVIDTLPSVEELRSSRHGGADQQDKGLRSDKADLFVGAPAVPPAEPKVSAAPAPTLEDEAEAYWASEFDDEIPVISAPALPIPVICRLGADAVIPAASSAADVHGTEDVEKGEAEGPSAEPVRPITASSPLPTAAGTVVVPPATPDVRSGTASSADVPSGIDHVRAAPLRRRKAKAQEEAASAESPSQTPTQRSPIADRRKEPERSVPAVAVDRSGNRTHTKPPMPIDGPAASQVDRLRPLSRDQRRSSLPPVPDRLEREDYGSRQPSERPSVSQMEEARRRAAHNTKLTTRLINDLTAQTPSHTTSTATTTSAHIPSPAPDDSIVTVLRSYAGSLMDWWNSRRLPGHDTDALRRRLDQTWRALLAATRKWLSERGAGRSSETVQSFLTREIGRNHPDAREAHEGWLDRVYQPAAAAVRVIDRTSEGPFSVRHNDGLRFRTGSERQRTGG
ncbi:hypothetical protein [Azospirillum sp. TSO5]|uniref:hypothetical protein n=1 Tax=Azospirillum sp. TSO5 TaxID=716760 RepID=UPI000D6147B9|nr:hypothetical protein [Azospirillum sp. TSO5]PWC91894.1 hypothetical protein TSO5_18745 [Azospirillum sp. TSO5]